MHRVAACVCLVVLCAAVSFAQEQEEKPVSFSLEQAGGRTGSARGLANLIVVARLDPGWHIYSLTQPPGGPVATRITVPDGQKLTLAGTIGQPKPIKAFDENFGIQTEFFDGSVRFTVPVRAAAGAAGRQTLRVDVYYQVCNDRVCLPPETQRLQTIVNLSGAPPRKPRGKAAL